MLDNKGLTETQQVTNLLHVASVNDCVVNQITLLLLCFLCENVAVVSVMSLDLTCTGETESLLCTGVCLYFWHCFKIFIIIVYNAVATHIPGVTHIFLLCYCYALFNLVFGRM